MLSSIQILRAIAVILVVLVHITVLAKKWLNDNIEPFYLGLIGVDIFFIISGFIMYLIISKKDISIYDFIMHRIIRIYPLYWIYFILLLVVALLFPSLVTSYKEANLISSFLLISSEFPSFLNVSWTLVYEVYFYFIVFIYLSLFVKKINFIYFLTILFSFNFLVSFYFNLPSRNNFYLTYFSPLLFEFLLGAIIYHLYNNKILFNQFMATLVCVLAIIFMFMTNLFYVEIDGFFTTVIFNGYLQYGRIIYFGLPSFIFVIAIVSFENYLIKKHNTIIKLFKLIGNASYSIYLSHYFILVGLVKLLSFIDINLNSLLEYLLIIILLLSISIFTGIQLYIYIEKPILKYLNNYKGRS